jgi:hypothetical protein
MLLAMLNALSTSEKRQIGDCKTVERGEQDIAVYTELQIVTSAF